MQLAITRQKDSGGSKASIGKSKEKNERHARDRKVSFTFEWFYFSEMIRATNIFLQIIKTQYYE